MADKAPKNNDLTTKVVKSGIWIYGRMLVTNLFNIVVIAILARQLSPAEFGLVALANVVIQFLRVLTSQGTNQFVIFDNEAGRELRVQAAFWIDVFLALCCAAIGIVLLQFLPRFFDEPQLGEILLVLLLQFPIDSLSKIPDALLKKSLDFKKLEIRDTLLRFFTGILSIIMAFTGWGVWSLIIPALIASPIKAFIVYRLVEWRPKLNFQFHLWPRVFSYSASVIGSSLTTFIISQGDTLLIGKLMGTQALGIYNLAWQAANLVCKTIVNLAQRLTLPALSKISGDTEKLQRAMGKILRLLSIISFPLLIGLFIVADDFILVVYGEQWEEAILPLRIMLIYAIRYSVGSPTGSIFRVVGRPDIGFKIGLVTVPFYLGAIWYGSQFGIVGVAAGVTVVRTLSGLISFQIAAKCIQQSFLDFMKNFYKPILAALIMGLGVWAFKQILDASELKNTVISLLSLITLGGAIFLILLRTKFNALSRELADISGRILGKQNNIVLKILNIQN